MRKVLGPEISGALLSQSGKYDLSSVYVDASSKKVLVSGEIYPKAEKSNKALRESLDKYFENVETASKNVGKKEADKEEDNSSSSETVDSGYMTVESSSGKKLFIKPLELEGDNLKYIFKNKEFEISVNKLKSDSVTKLKEFLDKKSD